MSQAQNKALTQSKEKRQSIKNKVLKLIQSRDTINEYQVLAVIGGKRATIIGRLSELQDEGLIYVVGTFNRKQNSIYKYEPNENKQKGNKLNRDKARFEKWVKLGEQLDYFERNKVNQIQIA